MSIVYVVTAEIASEGGWVIAVCATLDDAMKAAQKHALIDRPDRTLEWSGPTVGHRVEREWWADERMHYSGFQIAEWPVQGSASGSPVVTDADRAALAALYEGKN